MAVMDLVKYVTSALVKKKYILSIFIDLKKVFDTIDHAYGNMIKNISLWNKRNCK